LLCTTNMAASGAGVLTTALPILARDIAFVVDAASTVSKGNQTITNFKPMDGSSFVTTNVVQLFAQASSGLAVTNFTVISGSGVIAGLTNLTFTNSGVVSVTAAQTGDTNWNASAPVTNTFNVTRADQAILVFNPTSPQTYNTTNSLTTSGGSGTGAVSYAVQSGPGQIVSGTSLWVTATGTVMVVATSAADAMYVVQSTTGQVAVVKASQAITFPVISDQITTNTVGLSATASSGLLVTNFALVLGRV